MNDEITTPTITDIRIITENWLENDNQNGIEGTKHPPEMAKKKQWNENLKFANFKSKWTA